MNKTMQFEAKFSNIQPLNPLFSSCKIYVCYTGLNRNNSLISKSTIEKALPSIFNIPIVGEFIEQKDDFGSHGGKIEISDQGIKFIKTTIPYGVVPESATITWEDVTETNGNINEYLVIEGAYLWTGRYDEASQIIENGKGQSMEIEIESGSFDDNKNYEITDFNFSALCILGSDVEPCFESAAITAYHLNEDKFKKQFTQMIKELKFSLSPSISEVDINDLQEGGKNVDEILKMLEKYSLTLEQIQEKEINHEEYSLEELEEKVKEVFELNQDDNDNQDFALTLNQLRDELRLELREEKMMDNWGCEYTRYWFVDADDAKVYAEDSQDGYKIFGFAYAVSGDKVTIDFESKNRVKVSYVPMEDDDIAEFNLVSKERLEYEIQSKERQMEAQFSSDKETAVSEVQIELGKLKEQYSVLENENSELKQFKQNTVGEQRKQAEDELFEKFSAQLSDEDMIEVKEKSSEMTLEDMENKLYTILGKKAVTNFSLENKNKKDNKSLRIEIPEETKRGANKVYADIIEQYGK